MPSPQVYKNLSPEQDTSISSEERDDSNLLSFFPCTAHLLNLTLGSGLVGLPFTLKAFGLIGGVVFIFVMWLVTTVIGRWLILTACLLQQAHFLNIAQELFDKKKRCALEISLLFYNGGCCILYFIYFKFFGNYLLSTFSAMDYLEQQAAILLVIAFIVVRWFWRGKIESKRLIACSFVGVLSVTAMSVLLLVAALKLPRKHKEGGDDDVDLASVGSFRDFITAIPFTTMAFSYHSSLLKILAANQDRIKNPQMANRVLWTASIGTVLLNASIGVCGYLLLRGSLHPDMMVSLMDVYHNRMLTVGLVLTFTANVYCDIPLRFLSTCDALENLIKVWLCECSLQTSFDDVDRACWYCSGRGNSLAARRTFASVMIFLGAFLIPYHNMKGALEVISAFGSTPNVFIIPTFLFIKAVERYPTSALEYGISKTTRISAWVGFSLGVAITFSTMVSLVFHWCTTR